jgi:hypothetical protein
MSRLGHLGTAERVKAGIWRLIIGHGLRVGVMH